MFSWSHEERKEPGWASGGSGSGFWAGKQLLVKTRKRTNMANRKEQKEEKRQDSQPSAEFGAFGEANRAEGDLG